jgi:hypothetical protein
LINNIKKTLSSVRNKEEVEEEEEEAEEEEEEETEEVFIGRKREI